jgi:hypothetical protein
VGKGEWIEKMLGTWARRDGNRAGVKYAEAYRRFVLDRG